MNNQLKNQEGAALAVGLILLLIITLMGYTGMKGTMLQEKMAAGLHNRTLANSGANSALRQGEGFLFNVIENSNGVDIEGTESGAFSGIYSYFKSRDGRTDPLVPLELVEEFTKRNWNNSNGTAHSYDFLSVDVNARLKNNPQYLIYELKNAISVAGNSTEFGTATGGGDTAVQKAYAVVGKSNSGDGKTFSVVESIYTATTSSSSTN